MHRATTAESRSLSGIQVRKRSTRLPSDWLKGQDIPSLSAAPRTRSGTYCGARPETEVGDVRLDCRTFSVCISNVGTNSLKVRGRVPTFHDTEILPCAVHVPRTYFSSSFGVSGRQLNL